MLFMGNALIFNFSIMLGEEEEQYGARYGTKQ